ncbi:hypothetical protein [Streptomyces pilosus]|uniref:hypothetical protein n=1 Tax=Streptomyces pilosus TaxID=28893 RepID=UPI001675271B|nr:hypothetical protein [Streptomyces pilosus]
MMMGPDTPEPAVLETVTGSPFGMQLLGGTLPFFDPYGWTPEIGVRDALTALGWTARTFSGDDTDDALGRLTSLLETGPVMIGPVEMGYLRYQPGKTGPIGADHYLHPAGKPRRTQAVRPRPPRHEDYVGVTTGHRGPSAD